MPRPITHILFDLDGTLADTAPDLAAALNHVLRQHGKPPLALDAVRPGVSRGGAAMVRLGFGIDEADAAFAAIRDEFLQQYRSALARETVLFPGISELLARLEIGGYGWGVVTNKLSWLTHPLLAALGLAERAQCVVSGDTVSRPKPHPAALLHACRLLDCRPAQVVYVGDARRDIEAGRTAGTSTLIARYGYVDAADHPETWGADGMIDQPLELMAWLAESE